VSVLSVRSISQEKMQSQSICWRSNTLVSCQCTHAASHGTAPVSKKVLSCLMSLASLNIKGYSGSLKVLLVTGDMQSKHLSLGFMYVKGSL
jgi:hypothetical protein